MNAASFSSANLYYSGRRVPMTLKLDLDGVTLPTPVIVFIYHDEPSVLKTPHSARTLLFTIYSVACSSCNAIQAL